MASFELDEIDFEDQYDKVTILNESIREQEELESRIRRAEWTSTNKDERTKLEQRIVLTRRNRVNTS